MNEIMEKKMNMSTLGKGGDKVVIALNYSTL
jgi:hypothetical protein